jgi:serine/threonine-protein kinase
MREIATASPDEVRQELQRILSSEAFANAVRARRFLTYVVEEALQGRNDEIKESVLAIEVFDRPADFDPRVDTIVRVEAGKLRKRLQSFYEQDRTSGRVAIDIPKGSYVPRFRPREIPAVPADESPQAKPRLRWLALGGVALAVTLVAIVSWTRIAAPRDSTPPSVAVLPFLSLSPDSSNEYFADGLAEELTDSLARLGNLHVASRTSAFTFKGKQADVQSIGSKLQVGAVVEGSVRKDGDRIRITAQLVRTDDGYHLWSQSYDRQFTDILAVQEEIASAVARALEVKLGAGSSQRLRGRTASVHAFDLYLKGLSFANAQTTAEAERLLKEAISVDPSFAKAYAALSRVYLMGEAAGVRPTMESIAKAKAVLGTALTLNDQDAETHVAMSVLAARHEFDWTAAEQHLKRALEIDPNFAEAHHQLAQNVLAPQSRFEEAMVENKRALKLDPHNQAILVSEPWLLYLQRDYEGARRGFSQDSQTPDWLGGLSFVLRAMNRHDEALAVLDRLQQIFPQPDLLGFIGATRAKKGDLAGARQTLAQLTELSKTHYVSPMSFAPISIALNETDKAFELIEQARTQHESPLIFLKVDATFDSLRKDARFEKVLTEVGLSDKQIRERQSLIGSNYR